MSTDLSGAVLDRHDIAANLVINRVVVVPVALPLFLSVMGLVALWRRRSL